MSESRLVGYEVDNHIATITLNRPGARNAINGALRDDLNAAWERFRGDEDAWVGILTANGDVYCAGGDLKDGAGSVGTFAGTFWEKPTINSFESGMELFKPTIAAVHGPCVGYGLTGVLFCDFVIATSTAGLAREARPALARPVTVPDSPTVPALLRRAVEQAGSHAYVVEPAGQVTYAEADTRSADPGSAVVVQGSDPLGAHLERRHPDVAEWQAGPKDVARVDCRRDAGVTQAAVSTSRRCRFAGCSSVPPQRRRTDTSESDRTTPIGPRGANRARSVRYSAVPALAWR